MRHHKKIFKDDIEKLCKFIIASCEAISCLLSQQFRMEKNKIDLEAKQHSLSFSSEIGEEERKKSVDNLFFDFFAQICAIGEI